MQAKSNYDSILNFITFEMRYIYGALLVTYQCTSNNSSNQRIDAQHSLPSNPWFKVFSYVGERIFKRLNSHGILRFIRHCIHH